MQIDIVIICPVEKEFVNIRPILPDSKSVAADNNKFFFEFGQIKGTHFNWNVAILEPEFDPSHFAVKTSEVLHFFNPQYIFLAGIAGGIKDANIGDLVISTKAYDYEYRKENEYNEGVRPKSIENNCRGLLNFARQIGREYSDDNEREHPVFDVYFGPIASGKKLIASSGKKSYKIIKNQYNDTQAVEMEAYEFALVASRREIKYLNVRAISDLIDNKDKSDRAGHQDKGSKHVAIYLKHLISTLPKPETQQSDTLSVQFNNNLFSGKTFWRNSQKGRLTLYDNYLELESDQRKTIIRNLIKVEHIKQPGDWAKNWVRVTYAYDLDEPSTIFFSSSKPINWSAYFGGSKDVLAHFQKQQQKQISFTEAYNS